MGIDFETASANVDALLAWAREHDEDLTRNEATTRLQLIDRLLIDCLGWSREQVVAEDRLEGTYADYVLGRPARKLIVEAKREGLYFTLPAGFTRRVCKISTILAQNAALHDALRQAIAYANERGVGLAAVCNGHQLVAVVASRQDGVSPLDGRALVLPSLQELRSHFRFFWDNLSQSGVEVFNLYRTLRGEDVPAPPEKLSRLIPNFPGYRIRNTLQVDLQILGELFLEDLAHSEDLEDDFLRETYCPSGALSQYALVSKDILRARYSALFEQEVSMTSAPVAAKDGLSAELSADILAASLSRRPIVLLGDVGVGKTMFIRRFIRIDARDVLEDRAVVLYVDFRAEPAVARELSAHVHRSLTRQLLDKYHIDVEERNFVQGVYHGDLQRFDRGIYGDLKELDPQAYARQRVNFLEERISDADSHLKACLHHISSAQNRQIVLFLDNIDQRPADFQDDVFVMAQAMSANWPVTVFVSLRPSTFFLSRSKGSLSAYQPRVFTIAPPRVDLVIKRRVRFAVDQLHQTGRLSWFPDSISLQADVLEKYLAALLHSFDTNEELVEFIDNVSGGNVRRALDFVGTFIGSGHVDTEKIIDIVESTGSYVVTVHEFLRAVIFGDFEYYDPQASPIANVFDISTPDVREHFLIPLLLSEVELQGEKRGEEGFVPLDDVYRVAQDLGFTSYQVKFALDRAFGKHLLEMAPRFEGPDAAASCRITTIGAYTVRRMVRFFTYVDAMRPTHLSWTRVIVNVYPTSATSPIVFVARNTFAITWTRLGTGSAKMNRCSTGAVSATTWAMTFGRWAEKSTQSIGLGSRPLIADRCSALGLATGASRQTPLQPPVLVPRP